MDLEADFPAVFYLWKFKIFNSFQIFHGFSDNAILHANGWFEIKPRSKALNADRCRVGG